MKRIMLLTLVIIVIFPSCATVPKESAELSMELTRMIRSAQASHIALLDQYVRECKERSNEFLEKKWIPTFMENATKASRITEMVERERDAGKKAALISEFTIDASVEIEKRRASLIGSIDEIDNALRNAITSHYDDMLTVNQALTAHLASAAEVGEIRAKLLSSLNVNERDIIPFDKINGLLTRILEHQGNDEEFTAFVEEVKSILKGR